MKNRNKYTNLANGVALWALNSSSILFTLLSMYGLFMIRDFTIKQKDSKLKSLTEVLFVLAGIRGFITFWSAYKPSMILPYITIFINVVLFAISILVLKRSLKYIMHKLEEYELVNLFKRVGQGYYIIIIVDAILVSLLLLVLFTVFFPFNFLLNLVSILLNQSFNLFLSLGLTFIKYYASRSFTKSAMMLENAAHLEERM